MIEGLHSCKPGNEPTVGMVKTFIVIQNPEKDGKKAWTKIKAAPAEQGGQPYKIVTVKPTGHTDSYGNISFNIAIEPTTAPLTQPTQQTQPQAATGAASGSWGRSPETQARIERQHSQEMAIRYFAQRGGIEDKNMLRDVIDWFQRDIGRTPTQPTKPEPEAEPKPDDSGEPSQDLGYDERPF